MRILIHGLNYAPELTGIGKYTGEMGAWLAERGHDVCVITAPPYYPWWQVQAPYNAWSYKQEVHGSVRVYRCPIWVPKQPSAAKRIVHLATFALSSLLPFARVLQRERPDVVFTVEPSLAAASVAWAGARLAGVPTWLHVQDLEVDTALGLGLVAQGGVARAALAAEGRLMSSFDRVSSISGAMERRLASKGVAEDRIIHFPNWVDTHSFHPDAAAEFSRDRWDLSQEAQLVLYAGNMGRKQGLHRVLDVARQFAHERPDVVFLLVGEGAARAELQSKAEGLDNVRFHSLLPLEDLVILLAAADVHLVLQEKGAQDLVMPSKLTGIWASGGAAVVTAEEGSELHALTRSEQIAHCVEPDDLTALSGAIARLLDDAPFRAEMKGRARAYALAELDRDRVLERLEQQLEALCRDKSLP